MVASSAAKGKIGVLIEDHYDPTEFEMFNEYFPQQGYEVEYVTHLWGNPSVTYWANPEDGVIKNQVKVTVEVNSVKPSDYKAVLFIGAYAMDRLRYQEHVTKGQANQAPAVNFLRGIENQGVEDRHDLPFPLALLRGPIAHQGPQGHLRPQHHLRCRERWR